MPKENLQKLCSLLHTMTKLFILYGKIILGILLEVFKEKVLKLRRK